MHRLVCCATMLGVWAGCGLIDSDIADFPLRLPEKQVTIDTDQWMLTDSQSMPDVPCATMMSVCASGVEEFCAAGDQTCLGTCDGQSCELTVLVQLWNEFDLKAEVPELADIEEQPLGSVTVDRIYYSVVENTFNLSSPELTVYVAPQGVMEPGSERSQAIGTIAPVPAGQTIQEMDVLLTTEGKDRLRTYMMEYTTPFNIIVGTTVVLKAGDPIPTGRVVSVIRVDAHASLGL